MLRGPTRFRLALSLKVVIHSNHKSIQYMKSKDLGYEHGICMVRVYCFPLKLTPD